MLSAIVVNQQNVATGKMEPTLKLIRVRNSGARPIAVRVVDQVPDEFEEARLRKTVELRSVSGLVAEVGQARPRFASEPADYLGRRAAAHSWEFALRSGRRVRPCILGDRRRKHIPSTISRSSRFSVFRSRPCWRPA